jgi:hypothetical protein
VTDLVAAVEAGVRAMFLRARTGAYADLEFEEIPEEHRESWRENFAIGLGAAMALLGELAPQYPEYRLRYLKEGGPDSWYTTTPTRNLMASLHNLSQYRNAGDTAHLDERWVTDWREYRE